MKDRVDSFERLLHDRSIANISLDKLRRWIQMFGLASFVNLRHEGIKYSDAMAALDKRVHQMRPDKTCSTRNQYVPFFQSDRSPLLLPANACGSDKNTAARLRRRF